MVCFAAVSAARLTSSLSAVAACIAIVGCGDDSHKASTVTHAKPTAATRPGLSHPVYPRCEFPTFTKPKVSKAATPPQDGQSWLLSYLPLPLAPVRHGQTYTVAIVERSPAVPNRGVKGGRTVILAGRRVSLKRPTGKFTVYIAGWKTARANYLLLANGKGQETLKEFISCLP
jgi:hypothetical protein